MHPDFRPDRSGEYLGCRYHPARGSVLGTPPLPDLPRWRVLPGRVCFGELILSWSPLCYTSCPPSLRRPAFMTMRIYFFRIEEIQNYQPTFDDLLIGVDEGDFAGFALRCFDSDVRTRISGRIWRLNEPRLSKTGRFMQGRLGYRLPPDKNAIQYDDEKRDFVEDELDNDLYARIHYIVDLHRRRIVAETRRSDGITHRSLRYVFERLLNRPLDSRRFGVSSIPESGAFREWLKDVNLVTRASLKVDYPNPHVDEYHEFARKLLTQTGATTSNVQWHSQDGLDAAEDSLLDDLSDFVSDFPNYTRLSAQSNDGQAFNSDDSAMNRPLETEDDDTTPRLFRRMIRLYRQVFGDETDE